jgi:hypothetical protein
MALYTCGNEWVRRLKRVPGIDIDRCARCI